MSTPSIHNLDHLGLVAGMCRELRIADIIDAVIPKHGEHAVTHGQTHGCHAYQRTRLS